MLIFVFFFLTGLVLLFAPVLLLRFAVKNWRVQPKIFWKAGFAGIVAGTIVLGVYLNIGSAIPGFTELHGLVQALIIGLMTGLIVELGRFLVLDRMMPSVRNRETALVFGLGWPSIGMILLGALFVIGAYGMYNLLNTADVASVFPNADPEQLKFFEEGKKQVEALAGGTPLKGFSPLLEYVAILATDAAMSLMIVFGLNKKQTRYTWFAVGWRSLMSSTYIFNVQGRFMPIELMFCFWAVAAGVLVSRLQKAFKNKSAI